MEGSGFDPARAAGPSGPVHGPPVDPAGGTSFAGLSLVARILRARELAAAAAGLPPLDSDQVLDLQRTAGNLLTSGALARWIDALPAAAPVELRVSCTAGPTARYEIAVGGAAAVAVELGAGDAATLPLPDEGAGTLAITGPDGATVRVGLPPAAPIALALGAARFVAFADPGART
jgi:hypothetical protein